MIEHMKTKIHQTPVDIAIRSDLDTIDKVVYLVHGHTGNKEDFTIRRFQNLFAELGFEAVALDASRHGEQLAYPYTSKDTFIEQQLAMPEVLLETLDQIKAIHQSHYQDHVRFAGILGISMGGHIAYLLPKWIPGIQFIIPLIGAPDVSVHYQRTKSAFLKDRISECSHALDQLTLPDRSIYQNIHILQINGTHDDVVHYENSFNFHTDLPKPNQREHWYVLEEVGHTVTESFVETVDAFLHKILSSEEQS